MKVAQTVTAAGIPLYHRVVSGARHEGTETYQLLERLRQLAAPRRLLLVADSALVTNDNLAACEQAQMQFIARLPRSYGYEETALALDPRGFRKLNYCSERARRLPLAKRPTFAASEGSLKIHGAGSELNLRVLYVIGSEERQAARHSRARLLARAEQDLQRIANGLVIRPAKDLEKLSRRVAKAVAAGHVGDLLRTELNDDGSELRWSRDQAAIPAAERRDGLYALVTNLPPHQASAARLLKLYKDQAIVERTHHFLKGPLLVRPVFLHSNRRAAALVAICSYAVMVYGLIEAEVRAGIAPRRTIPALLPEGRAARPTAPNIFAAFAGLGFQRVRTRDGLRELPDTLNSAQKEILAILGADSILPA